MLGNQVQVTQGLVGPYLAAGGACPTIGAIYNAAIGVMQQPLPQTFEAQMGAARAIAGSMDFWLPELHSGAQVEDQYRQVIQPLFLRGFLRNGRVQSRTEEAFYQRRPSYVIRLESADQLFRMRSVEQVEADGILGIDVGLGVRSGVIQPDSMLLRGLDELYKAMPHRGSGMFSEIYSRTASATTGREVEVKRLLNVARETNYEPRGVEPAFARDAEMAKAGPEFRLALLKEAYARGPRLRSELPVHSLDFKSQVFNLKAGRAVPFVLLEDGAARYIGTDSDHAMKSDPEIFGELLKFAVLTPAKLNLTSAESEAFVAERVAASGWLTFDGEALTVEGVDGIATETVHKKFGTILSPEKVQFK